MPADKSVSVRVVGLNALIRGFKEIDAELPAAMREHLLGIAQMVAGRVRTVMPSNVGAAQGSVVARATSRGASVSIGNAKAPYAPWLDFGGSVGRGHKPGRAWSGAVKRDWLGRPIGEGRYLFPQISAARSETAHALAEALRDVALKAGFEAQING